MFLVNEGPSLVERSPVDRCSLLLYYCMFGTFLFCHTSQPFLRNSVVILKYMRAAAYFKDLTLKRRSAAAILGWYRHVKRWRRIRNMHAAAVVIQAREVPSLTPL